MDIAQLWIDLMCSVETWDKGLFVELNAWHSDFWDGVMYWVSDKWVWIPLYVSMLYMMLKNKRSETLLILLGVVLTIVLADQFSSSLCKPLVARVRPCNDPSLQGIAHVVGGQVYGGYSFISSHAANAFGLALFTALVFKNGWYSLSIFLWALLNSYSRIYLSAHFPMDVLLGALAGMVFALISYQLYGWLKRRLPQYNYSRHKTNSRTNVDFPMSDVAVYLCTYAGTFFFIFLFASRYLFA